MPRTALPRSCRRRDNQRRRGERRRPVREIAAEHGVSRALCYYIQHRHLQLERPESSECPKCHGRGVIVDLETNSARLCSSCRPAPRPQPEQPELAPRRREQLERLTLDAAVRGIPLSFASAPAQAGDRHSSRRGTLGGVTWREACILTFWLLRRRRRAVRRPREHRQVPTARSTDHQASASKAPRTADRGSSVPSAAGSGSWASWARSRPAAAPLARSGPIVAGGRAARSVPVVQRRWRPRQS
ncbi:MAG: hypothetical protein OXG81_13810 [Acidobacteria bacterium]|nr:hypothetical protein [Acidobacteriota bacterium]